ncbi:hypothetical protein [Rhodococcoides fascians]|uniref:hypothetical protein n=1 Tax=Rhodococcoides fascians TaxID=1828 RepID=UPI00068DD588|nr:hypothetical protein [Rhodococcus fascians]
MSTTSPPRSPDVGDSTPVPYEPPDSWIPADQRKLGLDRRTIIPGLVVLVIAAFISFGPTALDGRIDYDDPTVSGDVIAVGEDVTFTPIPGWNVIAGLREGQPTAGGEYPTEAVLTKGGVTFELQAASYDGTPDDLLDRIRDNQEAYGIESPVVESNTVAVTTGDGHRGVMAGYDGPNIDGIIAAFVGNGTGLEVVAVSPTNYDKQSTDDVARMIESITISGESQ